MDEEIFTGADDADLRAAVRDEARCHFDEATMPGVIRLNFPAGRGDCRMTLPRDIYGTDRAKRLERMAPWLTRQPGSHGRLIFAGNPERHFTIPDHDVLRAGTLSASLQVVAVRPGSSRGACLLDRLFA